MTPKVPTLHQIVTLKELGSGGWLWCEHGRVFKSATTAVHAVKRDAVQLSQGDKGVITIITWEPCSEAGRIVAKLHASGKI